MKRYIAELLGGIPLRWETLFYVALELGLLIAFIPNLGKLAPVLLIYGFVCAQRGAYFQRYAVTRNQTSTTYTVEEK